jgi:hypothetical protein
MRQTCGNWTKSGAESDRTGLRKESRQKSWNSSHPTRGCSQPGLISTGGARLLYCFATN